MLLEVSILSPREIIFEGKAKSIILPGEQGIFEVLPFHKNLLTLLVVGTIFIDDKELPIKRGIAKVELNQVSAIVEQ